MEETQYVYLFLCKGKPVSIGNTSVTKRVSFPHQAVLQFSVDTICASYNLILFDTNYLELGQTPQVKVQSLRTASVPHQKPVLSSVSPSPPC